MIKETDIKILALTRYGRLGASSRLRTFQYREPLALAGIELDIAPLFDDDYVQAIYGRSGRMRLVLGAFARRWGILQRAGDYDAILVEKEVLPWLPAFAELSLLPRRVPLIVDYDDAVFHRYDMHGSPVVRAVLGKKLDRVMARADVVIAGNGYLADHARKAGARRVELLPTVVDLDRYVVQPTKVSDTVTIGWIGSPNTARYLDIVKPVLQELRSLVRFECVAIGARPDQVAGSLFIAKPWTEEGEVDNIRAIDIGIMPLADTLWERGKCGYKLIQYMALGLPVVASPVGENSRIVRDGENGFLANSDAEWRNALLQLIVDRDMRAQFGSNGHKIVRDHYAREKTAPRLAQVISEVVQAKGRV